MRMASQWYSPACGISGTERANRRGNDHQFRAQDGIARHEEVFALSIEGHGTFVVTARLRALLD